MLVQRNFPDQYLKSDESVSVPKNGRIRVSTEKWYNPDEYQEKVDSVREQQNCPNEYRKMVESVSVPENGRIRARIEKLYGRVPKNCTISVSTRKW